MLNLPHYPWLKYRGTVSLALTERQSYRLEDQRTMDFVNATEATLHSLGLGFIFEFARWWYWNTTPLLWYAPYTLLLLLELAIGRKDRAPALDVAFNYAYLTVWIVVFTLITQPLRDFVAWLDSHYDGPQLDLTFVVNDSIALNILTLIVSLLIFDFFYYWWHRLQHKYPVLWVTHKLHHVDQKMGVTTTMKAHPVSVLGRTVLVALPIALFFKIEPVTIFWVGYAARMFQHFVHMNINCHFGRLGWLLASPNQHRIHHSLLPEHLDKNMASYFPIWDVVFGTYYKPGKLVPPTGVNTGEVYNRNLIMAFAQPFTDWWKMGAAWLRKRRAV